MEVSQDQETRLARKLGDFIPAGLEMRGFVSETIGSTRQERQNGNIVDLVRMERVGHEKEQRPL